MPAHASRTLATAPSAPPSDAERRLLAPAPPGKRRPHPPDSPAARHPAPSSFDRWIRAYTPEREKAFNDASWGVIDATLRRIGPNRDTLAIFCAGDEPRDAPKFLVNGEWLSAGQWLYALATRGELPGHPNGKREAEFREALGLSPGRPYGTALFPTAMEVFALLIPFVREGGYNVSVLNGMQAGGFRADDGELDPVLLMVEHDKPRRGTRRFSWEALIGKRVELQNIAEYLTDQARETMTARGHPTGALFIAWAQRGASRRPTGPFITDWSAPDSPAEQWTNFTGVTDAEGNWPSLQRLRRTHLAMSDVPRQNNPGRDGRCRPPPGQIRTCALTHTAPPSGQTAPTRCRSRVARVTPNAGAVSRQCRASPASPPVRPFAPSTPPRVSTPLCSPPSSLLWPDLIARPRASTDYGIALSVAVPAWQHAGTKPSPPRSRCWTCRRA